MMKLIFKNGLYVLGMTIIILICFNRNRVYANDSFVYNEFSFRIIKETSENGIGEVCLIGIESESEYALINGKYYKKDIESDDVDYYGIIRSSIIIPELVEYENRQYYVTEVNISYETWWNKKISNKLVFYNTDYLEFPASLKNIITSGILFESSEPKIVFKCDYSVAKSIPLISFNETSASGAVIYCGKDEVDLYQKKFNEDAYFSVVGSTDLGEREYRGVFVYPIGVEKALPKYFWSSDGEKGYYYDDTASYAAYYEVLNKYEYVTKCIDYEVGNRASDSDIIYIPSKVVFENDEYDVKILGAQATISINKPIYIEEGIEKLEPNSINGNIPILYLPDTLMKLPSNLFCGANRLLKYVRLPSKIKSIPKRIFTECKYLNSIKIPASVESIGKKAFGRNVKNVFFEGECPQGIRKAIQKTKRLSIYVHKEWIDAYNQVMTKDINDGKCIIYTCDFNYLKDFKIQKDVLNISDFSQYDFDIIVDEISNDYKIVWAISFPQNGMNISQNGEFKVGNNADFYSNKIYAVDVLTGIIHVCKLE